MKKVLLLIFSIISIIGFAVAPAAYAYQTVLVDFPPNQGWHADYYETQGGESILQYVPIGQTADSWTKSVIFHSYNNLTWTDSAAAFMDRTTSEMEVQNSSQKYRYTKYNAADSIAVRCVEKNARTPRQCEIYRVSKSHQGLISMHYINKNIADYKSSYNMWYQIMKDVRIYSSYYREDRIMDKATSFEL